MMVGSMQGDLKDLDYESEDDVEEMEEEEEEEEESQAQTSKRYEIRWSCLDATPTRPALHVCLHAVLELLVYRVG